MVQLCFQPQIPQKRFSEKNGTAKDRPVEIGVEISGKTIASGVEPKENNDTVRASGEHNTVRASGEKTTRTSGESVTAGASGERTATARASDGPKPEKETEADTRNTRTNGPHELAQIWYDFLDEKFSSTEMERLQSEFEALPESKDDEEITREEF